MTQRVPESACPTCGKVMDMATATDGSGVSPVEGDVTVCIGCGDALTFGPGLALAPLRWEDLDQETAAMLMRAQNAVLDMKGAH